MQSQGIDFFDVDHTLTKKSSGRHFIVLGVRKGIFPIKVLVSIPYYYIYYRFGNLKLESIKRGFPELKGIKKSELEELSRETFERKLIHDIYPEAKKIIEELLKSGREVVLATSSVDVIVRPLADYLNIKHIIATELEYSNDICTGALVEAPIFADEKKRKVLEFIERRGVSPEECSFYSDSIHDLPLLEAVGKPVVVNPDPRLKSIAKQRNWKILKFS